MGQLLRWWLGLSWMLWMLAACAAPTLTPAPSYTLTPVINTPTPLAPTLTPAPTSTPEPLAATVNGTGISLALYQKERARCEAGLINANLDASGCPTQVLDTLIDQALIEQLAGPQTVSDEEVQAALAQVVVAQGSAEAYQVWLATNLYTEAEFAEAVRRELLRARILAQAVPVPETAEQIHALALVVADEATAQALKTELAAGADFATLAVEYSLDLSTRPAGGDLGWFPRGILTVPEVEAAAFALPVGATSEVIHSALGYHLVQVLERDPARPLNPAARQRLRGQAYQTWLAALRAQADVQIFIQHS